MTFQSSNGRVKNLEPFETTVHGNDIAPTNVGKVREADHILNVCVVSASGPIIVFRSIQCSSLLVENRDIRRFIAK
jgi:hypothetical protein